MSGLEIDKESVVCSTCKKRVAEAAAIIHDGTGPSLFFCSEHCIDDYMENQAGRYFEADHVPDDGQDDDEEELEEKKTAVVVVEEEVIEEDDDDEDIEDKEETVDDEDEAQDS